MPSAVTDWLCCDAGAACPSSASDTPSCAAFALANPRRTVGPLVPEHQHIAVVVATNIAGDEVLGAPSDAFVTLSLPATAANSDGDGDGDNSAWKQVAMWMAVMLGVALAVVAVVKYRRHREQNRAKSTEELTALLTAVMSAGDGPHPATKAGWSAERRGSGVEIHRHSELRLPQEVPRKHLERLGDLGQGQFGKVTKALLSGWKNIPSFMIAVKEAKKADEGEELLREALVMQQFDHPNVLGCVGICTTQGGVAVLME